ncbi:hypothetical protein, partial [Streptomyces sp. NPDC003487]
MSGPGDTVKAEIEETDGGLVQVAGRPARQVVARATRSLNEIPGHCARAPTAGAGLLVADGPPGAAPPSRASRR